MADTDACACALQLLGMLLYVGAWLCALATTLMPQWLTMSTQLLAIESYEQGLWETCVVQDGASTECRAYDGMLGLSRDIKLARISMCLSLAVGLAGWAVAIPGLQLVDSPCRGRGGRRAKRILTVAGGSCGMLSGALCLFPVSYVAHITVVQFFDESLPEVVPRWEFGDALFCGWVGGFLLLVAGLLLVASGLCSGGGGEGRRLQAPGEEEDDDDDDPRRRPTAGLMPPAYQVRNSDNSTKKRSEYV